ncbi:hypothetical protein [Nocardia niwae]|uniref:Uncharacterized protein n=1 Tax=Nocardia niwae TaxID=626084 RepID=A0ABV2X7R5_9NOCA|nr:hypothetical protein [Nocardia niwae]
MEVRVGDRVRLVPGGRQAFRVLEIVGAFALVVTEPDLNGGRQFGVLTASLIPNDEQA